MAHMSIPCHEGPPATTGHLCSEPAVAGGGRYYCIQESLRKRKYVKYCSSGCTHSHVREQESRNIETYFINIAYPVLDVFERLFVRDIIHQHDTLKMRKIIQSCNIRKH